MQNIDAIDLQILALLQPDARMPNTALAKELGMAPSAVLERVRKLEARGVIEDYTTRIRPEAVEQKLLAFIFIRTSTPPGDMHLSEYLSAIPEILELHVIAGEDCLLAKVRAADAQALVRLMRDRFAGVPGLLATKTTIVLETIKEKNHLIIRQTV